MYSSGTKPDRTTLEMCLGAAATSLVYVFFLTFYSSIFFLIFFVGELQYLKTVDSNVHYVVVNGRV